MYLVRASQKVQWYRIHLPVQKVQKTWVRSLSQEYPLEEEMATHSSILAFRIPWTREPDRLQSLGSQKIRHDRAMERTVQSLSRVQICDPMDCSTPGFPVHCQLPEFIKLMSIELVMPSNHLIPCCPLLHLPSIFPSIRVFSNE